MEKLRDGMVLDTPSSALFQESSIEGLPSISTEDLRACVHRRFKSVAA